MRYNYRASQKLDHGGLPKAQFQTQQKPNSKIDIKKECFRHPRKEFGPSLEQEQFFWWKPRMYVEGLHHQHSLLLKILKNVYFLGDLTKA